MAQLLLQRTRFGSQHPHGSSWLLTVTPVPGGGGSVPFAGLHRHCAHRSTDIHAGELKDNSDERRHRTHFKRPSC